MSTLIDLTNKLFRRLIVIKRTNNDKQGRSRWLCKCDCGKEIIVSSTHLQSGKTQSCGCLNIDKITKHGHNKNGKQSKTYIVWSHMIQRCTNAYCKEYRYYGSRGIKVCKRWLKFENFLKDMGEAPDRYQIDRIENNKGYYTENCQWVTKKQQMRNKRDNHLITFEGKTRCMAEWSEIFNINYNTLQYRLNHRWSIQKALITPVRKKRVL